MKRKQRAAAGSAADAPAAPAPATAMSLLRLRAIEHGVEESDLASVSALGEVLPLLARLKDGQDDLAMQALHTLRRAFLALIKRGDVRRCLNPSSKTPPSAAAAKRPRFEAEAKQQAAEADTEAGAQEAALRVFQSWVYEQYQAFVGALLGLLGERGGTTARVRVAALRTLMELVKVEGHTYRRPRKGFGHALFGKVVRRLVESSSSSGDEDGAEVVAVLKVDYVEPFFDVRYWLLRSLRVLAAAAVVDGKGKGKGKKGKAAVAAIFKLLMLVTVPATEAEMLSFFVPFVEEGEAAGSGGMEGEDDADEDDDDLGFDFGNEEEDEDDAAAAGEEEEEDEGQQRLPSSGSRGGAVIPLVVQLSAHRKALGEAWLACLKLGLPTPALYRTTTQFVARHVLDVMPNPLQLADFFTAGYAQGDGLTSLLALEGLFVLMQQHNLEYPQFYASLYRLLGPRVLFSRHRPRFFRLLRLCLSSPYVPAHVIAAFLKRLCRLALLAPPPSVIFVLTLVVVVLRRHPACQSLIHRTTSTTPMTAGEKEDAFDFSADDPALALKEGAVTSLWEVAALQKHYYPSVATLAKGLEASVPEDPKAAGPFAGVGVGGGGALDEMASITYAALFAQEAKERRVRVGQDGGKSNNKRGSGRRKGKGAQEEEEVTGVALVYQPPKRPGTLFQPGDCFDGLFALTGGGGGTTEGEGK